MCQRCEKCINKTSVDIHEPSFVLSITRTQPVHSRTKTNGLFPDDLCWKTIVKLSGKDTYFHLQWRLIKLNSVNECSIPWYSFAEVATWYSLQTFSTLQHINTLVLPQYRIKTLQIINNVWQISLYQHMIYWLLYNNIMGVELWQSQTLTRLAQCSSIARVADQAFDGTIQRVVMGLYEYPSSDIWLCKICKRKIGGKKIS